MKRKKIYLSGPITGLERDDYMERFAIAERELKKLGYKVVNPTKFLICRCPWIYMFVGYRLTLAYDIWRLMHCDEIFLLPGWINSSGANIEMYTARYMGIFSIEWEQYLAIYGIVSEFIRNSENLKQTTHNEPLTFITPKEQ